MKKREVILAALCFIVFMWHPSLGFITLCFLFLYLDQIDLSRQVKEGLKDIAALLTSIHQ